MVKTKWELILGTQLQMLLCHSGNSMVHIDLYGQITNNIFISQGLP